MSRLYGEHSLTRKYRSVEEIYREIREVASRISEINEMLNIRELVCDIFSAGEEDIVYRAENVAAVYSYAAEVLSEMRELYSSLESLKTELCEALESVNYAI